MNHQRLVQIAVMCIEALDDNAGEPLSAEEISRKQGVPFAECMRTIQRLSNAGIVDVAAAGKVTLLRPVDQLTALEILQAVWARETSRPGFQMLVGEKRSLATRTTLEFVRGIQSVNEDPEING